MPDAELLRVATRDGQGTSEVTVTGEVDVTNAGDFERALVDAVDRADAVVTLDLRGVDYLGSDGVRGLMHAHRLASERGVRWEVSASEIVHRALETAGLGDWLDG